MKSTVPVGTGEKIRHGLDERGLHGLRLRLEPRVPRQRGAPVRGLHAPGPDRDRGLRRLADGDAVAGLYGGSRARSSAYGVNSAEMIKLASNAALMTRISFINEIAEVCEKTGADVVEVAEGVGPRPSDRAALPPAGHRLRRQLLSQGRVGAEAARRQLRLPLPAADRGDRGQRAAEAARDRQARRSTSARCVGKRWRCWGWRSSPTPTTCARPRSLGARGAAAGGGGRGARLRPGRRGRARKLMPGVEFADLGARGDRGRRRRSAGDRVAGVRRARLGRHGAADARAGDRRRPQLPRPGQHSRAAGFSYEGIGR